MQSQRMMLLAETLVTPPQTPWEWLVAMALIVGINIVLSGDNAVVIALAVRNLPPKQRKMGIIIGAGAAVALRVVLTAVTAQLLSIPYLKLVGGLLILWIAFQLLKQEDDESEAEKQGAQGIWSAVWMILVADVTMSLDNVMAVSGAARGSFPLILFGLGLSIPLVVFGSNLISQLMNRYQIIVFIGAAILGKVGGEMMVTDNVVAAHLVPWWGGLVGAKDPLVAYGYLRYAVEVTLAGGIFLIGWSRRRPAVQSAG